MNRMMPRTPKAQPHQVNMEDLQHLMKLDETFNQQMVERIELARKAIEKGDLKPAKELLNEVPEEAAEDAEERARRHFERQRWEHAARVMRVRVSRYERYHRMALYVLGALPIGMWVVREGFVFNEWLAYYLTMVAFVLLAIVSDRQRKTLIRKAVRVEHQVTEDKMQGEAEAAERQKVAQAKAKVDKPADSTKSGAKSK